MLLYDSVKLAFSQFARADLKILYNVNKITNQYQFFQKNFMEAKGTILSLQVFCSENFSRYFFLPNAVNH